MQNEQERADMCNLQKLSCVAHIAQFLEYDDVEIILHVHCFGYMSK